MRILLIMAEGDEFLQLWLVTREGIAICFRCRDREILEEVFLPRHFAVELPGPRLGTLAQPSREAGCQAADRRSGKRR